jgi:MoaA/NifB/PqqE/SkfB family radical SAM enzyme
MKKMDVKLVVMSGGEALLNANFFKLCDMLQKQGIAVSLLSTGLLLKKYAAELAEHVNDIIVSLDGEERIHNAIRNIDGAYNKLKDGVAEIKRIDPSFKITARSVIHRLNFRCLPQIIDSAKELGLDQISFLPADVSSHAFNREVLWNNAKQNELLLTKEELGEMKSIIDNIMEVYAADFSTQFIAEPPAKFLNIYNYYAAFYGLNNFPYKKCNAPWVSTVIEADGTVRPCFFHEAMGNIHKNSLDKILNNSTSIEFRKGLDMSQDGICVKCVCSLNLNPTINPAAITH